MIPFAVAWRDQVDKGIAAYDRHRAEGWVSERADLSGAPVYHPPSSTRVGTSSPLFDWGPSLDVRRVVWSHELTNEDRTAWASGRTRADRRAFRGWEVTRCASRAITRISRTILVAIDRGARRLYVDTVIPDLDGLDVEALAWLAIDEPDPPPRGPASLEEMLGW